VSKVAIVEVDGDIRSAMSRALKLIGGISDLNSPKRRVVVKVGVYDHRAETHPTVGVVDAIAGSFDRAPKVYIAESDSPKGRTPRDSRNGRTLSVTGPCHVVVVVMLLRHRS